MYSLSTAALIDFAIRARAFGSRDYAESLCAFAGLYICIHCPSGCYYGSERCGVIHANFRSVCLSPDYASIRQSLLNQCVWG